MDSREKGDREMKGEREVKMEGQTNGAMTGEMCVYMYYVLDMHGRMGRWRDGWTDGQTDGWTDGRKSKKEGWLDGKEMKG